MSNQKNLNLSALLCLLPVALTLLNTDYLGISTLSAYFGFVISVAVVTIVILLIKRKNFSLPIPVLLFILFSLYVFFHGIATRTTNLTHYYWIASSLWMLSCYMLNTSIKVSLLYGIAIIAFGESLIVLLQAVGIMSSKNPFFATTGTWMNPNVTAMFLAMSLFALLKLEKVGKNKIVFWSTLLGCIAAICLLQCRSAYLVAGLFLAVHYSRNFIISLSRKWKRGARLITVSLITLFILFAFILSFSIKEASSSGRLRIWKNSLGLIMEKPAAGHGFGLFEQVYNMHLAKQQVPEADHVYMPYNDYIELGIEGGIIAIILWLAFMISLFVYNRKNKISVLPVLAFSIIQVTNFGFQAIPAFILFILYAGCENFRFLQNEESTANSFNMIRFKRSARLTFLIVVFFTSLFLFVLTVKQTVAFREVTQVMQTEPPGVAINEYEEIESTLKGYAYFHEHYGDAYLQSKQYQQALQQYLQALRSSAKESIIGKIGFCYQQERKYDSSEYYFTLLQNLVPSKFSPRMALLNLYQQKKDTSLMLSKAIEIRDMPVKVQNNEVTQIKNYAITILNQVQR